ncbi:uncharacterized protein LOC134472019 [Cavia porcellus]|uniref:uncharacterized protein LOC134472019 n=1 Tax=Cavia porcellus TaxID=10141 RepID=UPI002FDFDCAA
MILHQHQQALTRSIGLIQGARRADLSRLAHRTPCAWGPRRKQNRRIVVLIQHKHLQSHVAAQGRHPRVARAHLELQQLQLLVVQRLQREHLAALRVHRHVARQRALAHPPLHQRVGHQRVLLRVRVARAHSEDVGAWRVVLLHEHRVLGLREQGRVVVHVGHLHGNGGRGPQRWRTPIPSSHHYLIVRYALAVQRAVQYQRIVILEAGHQLERIKRQEGAGHLPICLCIQVSHANQGNNCPNLCVLFNREPELFDSQLWSIVINIHNFHKNCTVSSQGRRPSINCLYLNSVGFTFFKINKSYHCNFPTRSIYVELGFYVRRNITREGVGDISVHALVQIRGGGVCNRRPHGNILR